MTTNTTGELEALGFSEYEARAYLALLQAGPMTGYQLAKVSGIPRPNIYPVLVRLEQRGAVNRSKSGRADRYSALPSEQMLLNTGRSFTSQLARARDALKEMTEAPVEEQVWNIDGYSRVLDRARDLIDRAADQLLVCVWSNESAQITNAVERARERGVDVTTLCVQGCPDECGGCQGRLYRYDMEAPGQARSLVIVADRRELLVAQCHADGQANGAATRMPAFVSIAAQFVTNTVAVAEIARCSGPQLGRLLDEDAREAVHRAGLRLDATSWLQRLIQSSGRAS